MFQMGLCARQLNYTYGVGRGRKCFHKLLLAKMQTSEQRKIHQG